MLSDGGGHHTRSAVFGSKAASVASDAGDKGGKKDDDKSGKGGTRGAGAKTGGAEPLVTVQMVDEFDLGTALGGSLVTVAVAAAIVAAWRRNG